MKCVVLRGPRDMIVEERESASNPGPGHVLIEVKAVGICGSDIHAYRGTQPFQSYPRILGHELAGEVSYPAGRLSEGERVTMEPLLRCGKCYPCRTRRYNCCTELKVIGVHADGGMCNRLWVPSDLVYPLPKSVTLEQGALIEPTAIGCQAVGRSRLEAGETALVIGAGPIGLMILQVARARGAEVFISDIDPERLALGESLGAEEVINPREESLGTRLEEITSGEGPVVVFEAVGSEATIKQALNVVSAAGRVVIVGLCSGGVELQPSLFIRKELDLLGSRNSSGRFPEALGLVLDGKVRARELITHRFPLEMAPRVFEEIDQGRIKPVKALLLPSSQ